jgi:hypothetical protein
VQTVTLVKASQLQDINGEPISLSEITTDLQALTISYTDTTTNKQIVEVLRVLSDLSSDDGQ